MAVEWHARVHARVHARGRGHPVDDVSPAVLHSADHPRRSGASYAFPQCDLPLWRVRAGAGPRSTERNGRSDAIPGRIPGATVRCRSRARRACTAARFATQRRWTLVTHSHHRLTPDHEQAAGIETTEVTHADHGLSKVLALKGYVLARSGCIDDARGILAILESAARSRYVPPVSVALVHAGLGDANAMFEWLDHAARVRDVHLVFLPVDPMWQPYCNDPRFQGLTERFRVLTAA